MDEDSWNIDFYEGNKSDDEVNSNGLIDRIPKKISETYEVCGTELSVRVRMLSHVSTDFLCLYTQQEK